MRNNTELIGIHGTLMQIKSNINGRLTQFSNIKKATKKNPQSLHAKVSKSMAQKDLFRQKIKIHHILSPFFTIIATKDRIIVIVIITGYVRLYRWQPQSNYGCGRCSCFMQLIGCNQSGNQ